MPPLKIPQQTDAVEEEGDKEDAHSSRLDTAGRRHELDLDTLQFPGIKREHWWQLWRPRHAPLPPKASLDDAEIIPLAYVSQLSKFTFQWVTPIMIKGYQRPLQATDLWKLDPSREAEFLSTRFLECLADRQKAAEEWNQKLATMKPTHVQRLIWISRAAVPKPLPADYAAFGPDGTLKERRDTLEAEWRKRSGRKRGSVTWALNDTMTGFWAGGLFKVLGDVSQMMSPLLVKALINFSKEVYAAKHGGNPQPNIGRGVGMAIGLFCLTVMQSLCQHQFFFRSMAFGVLARAALISAVYKQSLRLSVEGRARHPNGTLLTYLSSDISRIDYCAQWFHAIWTAPIQLIVILILLIIQIGPSAIVGFSLFVVIAPLQTWFMKASYVVRKKSMKWTDSRSRLLRELLSSMEIIKVFTYELPFLQRLNHFRRKEMIGIRKILIIRAANQALAFSVPTLASVLSFVTYAATHNNLDPVFEADTILKTNVIDPSIDVAVRMQNASFSWLSGPAVTEDSERVQSKGPFRLPPLTLDIPRGKIIGIVGTVGSGKSSLLQGLIGEMSMLSGSVTFGGRLAYCQQNAWIQNATVRDNIVFGQAWDEHRYWKAVKDANLLTDLELLGDGDLTEIGEKGINLSGGQKQRVNIARALYYNADIILFDDPLSAVDAHVGKALFENAILPLRDNGKTVLLVTHALHFLPRVDHIYAMSQGRIVEQGTYADLVRAEGSVAKLFDDFGGVSPEHLEEESVGQLKAQEADVERLSRKIMGKAAGTGKLEGRLMVSEVRKTGSVGGKGKDPRRYRPCGLLGGKITISI
ncbi:hypothetical protein IAR55_002095 [Kwoniella newhampshirensis]|uniref:ABC transporter n=1 Tax=Kwoniella newhampshirensis TaxID=1651941 RepID=A0AAW0Z1J0_9TREE